MRWIYNLPGFIIFYWIIDNFKHNIFIIVVNYSHKLFKQEYSNKNIFPLIRDVSLLF
ncbi:Uncharacterised protein [Klebsiella pneumoniae]|uniref:Uncharacterized protein n=1 Tax=Klebsiella pneumoniae TaxID=573 RepID=A0AB74QVQ6_KLEPN|nr:Uncharacterised protein [Klebsiella pneumoniae]CAF2447898.1 hypothetical protein AI2848V1_1320 [Klebsiella pneumoniae]CAH1062512.1 hypothetical protein AFEHPNKK_01272 [Klebsiella pneumoniae]CAH5135043.1 hypothetical protein AI2848V1_1320 [Klebsiella pneumoniae]SAV23889.1 Uncharacterised protein [Klebsiella pneumoniae]